MDGDAQHFEVEFNRVVSTANGDGVIVFILPGHSMNIAEAEALALKATSNSTAAPIRLIAIPDDIVGLENAILQVEAWHWVRNNEPTLGHDRVARQEASARLAAARTRLDELVSRVFGLPGFPFDPGASTWIAHGELQPPRSSRDFTRWLSHLCDRAFEKAPVLRNELLNRSQLSSAAARARRNLLEAMITHHGVPHLGIQGSPPESTMYESLLAIGGFHAVRNGRWGWGAPGGQWEPIWRAIDQWLQDSIEAPRPYDELIKALQAPPFGLRAGPIPIVVVAMLLARGDEVALYEQGTFLPELRIEALERLLRKPEDFSLRLFKQDDSTRRVLAALHTVTSPSSEPANRQQDQLISVVRALIVFVSKLVPYARSTRRFDNPFAAAVRNALLQASDPFALIFTDLPRVLDVSIHDYEGVEHISTRLRQVVRDLQRAYPDLLEEIEAHICQAFGLFRTGSEAADELRERSEPLKHFSADRRLTSFIREATRHTSDWRESLGRVVLDGQPPSHWKDVDVVTFQTRIQLLAGGFLRLEELKGEHETHGGGTVLRVDVLNGHFAETRALLTVPAALGQLVEELDAHIDRALSGAGTAAHRREIRIAALARALAREAAAAQEGLNE
jgi:hypothetical protein